MAAARDPVRELLYIPVPMGMKARGMATLPSSAGCTVALASYSQVLVLALNRARLERSGLERIANIFPAAQGRPEISCIDTRVAPPRSSEEPEVLIAVSLASEPFADCEQGARQPPSTTVTIALLPSGPPPSGPLVARDAESHALGFVPLVVQWLHGTDRPALAVSDADTGRLRVLSVARREESPAKPTGGSGGSDSLDGRMCVEELDDGQSAAALRGLSRLFPSSVLALAEWTCPHTARSARVACCEDGTIELALLGARDDNRGTALERIRVERAINVARFFGDSRGSHPGPSELGEPPVVHLFVGSVLCGACVYVDVLRNGLHAPVRALSDAESVLCCSVWRAHRNALLVGTWARILYCLELVRAPGAAPTGWLCGLAWSLQLPHAVYAVEASDVTNDGVEEIVVRTLQGIHVLQEELSGVCVEVEAGLNELFSATPARLRACAGGEDDELRRLLRRRGALADLQQRLRSTGARLSVH
jgi:hypothetical protein